MTKASSSRPNDPAGDISEGPPSATPEVRYVSFDSLAEDLLEVANRLLRSRSPRRPERADVHWLQVKVHVPLGIEFHNRLARSRSSVIRALDLETWAASVALTRWAQDLVDAISPLLFDPSLPSRPPFPLDIVVPNWFSNAVGYDIEHREFLLGALAPSPEEDKRLDWVEDVLRYGRWAPGGATLRVPSFFPRFIDRKGRDWTVPYLPVSAIDTGYSEWGQRILGWLSELRSPTKHPKGSRFPDQVWRRIAELNKEQSKPTYNRLVYLLQSEGFSPREIPSARSIRLRNQRLRNP